MKHLLVEIKGAVDTAKAQNQRTLESAQISDYEQRYTAILQASVEAEEKEAPPASGSRGPKQQSKSKNLLDRLGEYQEEMLAFMKNFAAPFDNNRGLFGNCRENERGFNTPPNVFNDLAGQAVASQ
jgi:Transposase IS66 family